MLVHLKTFVKERKDQGFFYQGKGFISHGGLRHVFCQDCVKDNNFVP